MLRRSLSFLPVELQLHGRARCPQGFPALLDSVALPDDRHRAGLPFEEAADQTVMKMLRCIHIDSHAVDVQLHLLAIRYNEIRQKAPLKLREIPVSHVRRCIPVILHALILDRIIQHREVHHRTARPAALQNIGHRLPLEVRTDASAVGGLHRPSRRLSQIVDARPDHAPDDIGIPLRDKGGDVLRKVLELVRMSCEILIDLRSQNGLVRHRGMNFLVPLLLVVAGEKIHLLCNAADARDFLIQIVNLRVIALIHELLNVLNLRDIHIALPLEMRIHGAGHRARCVQSLHAVHQHPQNAQHGILSLVLHLVADAPEDDGGTVPVPLHHAINILFPVLLEKAPVMPAGPLVKAFLIDIKAELITQIQEFRCVDVVCRADGIHADFLEPQEPCPHHLLANGDAHRPCILVQADAVQLHRLPVDPQALLRINAHITDADPHGNRIRRPIVFPSCQRQKVKVRILRRPEPRLLQAEIQLTVFVLQGLLPRRFRCTARRSCFLTSSCLGAGSFLCLRRRPRKDSKCPGDPCSVFPAGYPDPRRSVLRLPNGPHDDLRLIQNELSRLHQLHRAVDSGAAVPPVCRENVVRHTDPDGVRAGHQCIRYLQTKRGVAVIPAAHLFAVHIDRALFVYTAEIQKIPSPALCLHRNGFLIPAGPRQGMKALGRVLRAMNIGRIQHPVVGQVHTPCLLLLPVHPELPVLHQ